MKLPAPPRRLPEDAVAAVRDRGERLAAAVKRRVPVEESGDEDREAERDEVEKTPGKANGGPNR